MTTAKPWDIPIGALVSPCPFKTTYSSEHPDYKIGIVTDRAEYPEDDLAGPISYQIQWNGVVGYEWWMPEELVVLT